MNQFKLSQKSIKKLDGVHPDLVAVVKRAIEITEIDFSVLEGLRSLERQRVLFAGRKTKTLRSKHLKQQDGFGHAVDCVPYVNGRICWNTGNPWPGSNWLKVAQAFKAAAQELGVLIVWGGDWGWDAPHYELKTK